MELRSEHCWSTEPAIVLLSPGGHGHDGHDDDGHGDDRHGGDGHGDDGHGDDGLFKVMADG